VEEAAAAAKSMEEQTDAMTQMVSEFVLDAGHMPAPKPKAAPEMRRAPAVAARGNDRRAAAQSDDWKEF